MNPKVTVIGGAGFIGSHLVELLLAEGYQVTVIDNLSSGKKSNLKNLKIDLRVYDITDDPQMIASMIKGSECVFHLAALTSVQGSLERPTAYNLVNVIGTANVLEACRLADVKRFVFSSTSAVYGNTESFPTKETVTPEPMSTYALTKLIGEQYCKMYSELYGIHTTCLRYFNVYGDRTNLTSSYRSVIPIFLENSKAGKPLPFTNDGGQSRDFVHVTDVANANLAAIGQKRYHDIINIGSGKSVTVNELMEVIGGECKSIGARLEPRMSLANIARAEAALNWKPSINLLDWIKDQTL
jgi:UDP-glucose 4-epimerase